MANLFSFSCTFTPSPHADSNYTFHIQFVPSIDLGYIRLDKWLQMVLSHHDSEDLKKQIANLKSSIQSATLTTFPECLGGHAEALRNEHLQEAVNVFMDYGACTCVCVSARARGVCLCVWA
jgi:hypothetical protein